MNVKIVEQDLDEALIHLQNLLGEFRAGKIQERDEPVVAVQLGHILDHISRAWNCKDLTWDQWASLSQAEFDRLSKTVPNFLGERALGEFALS